jgi:hypothetical protein
MSASNACVRVRCAQLSGGTGIGLPHAGRRAAASLTAVRQLAAMRDMLASRAAAAAARATTAPGGTLGMHLTVLSARGGAGGLGLAALALAPEEAATLARLFARYDADDDEKLTASELRSMMSELLPPGAGGAKQQVSDEAARAALSLLDADGDGLVELDEFAAWYASSRLWRQNEAVPVAEGEPTPEEQHGESKKDA